MLVINLFRDDKVTEKIKLPDSTAITICSSGDITYWEAESKNLVTISKSRFDYAGIYNL